MRGNPDTQRRRQPKDANRLPAGHPDQDPPTTPIRMRTLESIDVMMNEKPTLELSVVMTRRRNPNPWETWGFSVDEVRQADDPELAAPAADGSLSITVLHDSEGLTRFLHRGLRVELHRDEAEGYHLNLSSDAPVWFVMWRVDDADPSMARPAFVTLSYHEAGRLLDAQERVDNVPLPAEVAGWLFEYVQMHYRPEPKKRRRPASFVEPGQRQ